MGRGWLTGIAGGLWLAWATAAHAGAWLQPAGETLAINTTEWTVADTAFDAEGEALDPVEFRKIESRLYSERGLSNTFTLTAQAALQDVTFRGREGRSQYTGPSAVRAGLRTPLWRSGRHVLSLEGDLGIQRGGEFVSDGELRQRGVSATATALYGYGWNRAFVDVQVGRRHRFGVGPDTWRLDAALGVQVHPRVALGAGLSARLTGEGLLAEDDLVLDSRSLKGKLSARFRWSCRTQVEVSGLATLAGRNHVREGGLGVGVWRSFGPGATKRCVEDEAEGRNRPPLDLPFL